MGRNHDLAIYLHRDFKYVVRHPLCFTSEDLDALVIDVKGDSMKKPATIINLYRLNPYSAALVESFNKRLNTILKKMGTPVKYQFHEEKLQ